MVSLMLDVVGQHLNRDWAPSLPVRKQ